MKKFFATLITIILFAWVALLAYDYYRATKNEPPLIIVSEKTVDYNDGTVTEYNSLGYKYIVYKRSSRKGYVFGGFWVKIEEK